MFYHLSSTTKRKDSNSFKNLIRNADVKAIFCDIDGTLTDERLVLSVAAINAIRRLNEAGLPTILSSGSCWYAVDIFARYIPSFPTFISENGAVIMSRSRFFSLDEDGLFSLGKPEKETIIGSPTPPRKCLDSLREIIPREQIVLAGDMPFRKVEVVLERLFPFDLLQNHASEGWLAEHVRVIDTKFAYHISPKEVNKGRALQITCREYLSVPVENTLAVGDGSNDVEMIDVAGVGVALANGDPVLKQSADYVTNDPFGLGFQEVAETILKL